MFKRYSSLFFFFLSPSDPLEMKKAQLLLSPLCNYLVKSSCVMDDDDVENLGM